MLLANHARQTIPANFQPRRADAIANREILPFPDWLTLNVRTDFNDIDLYRGDELFMNAFGLDTVASEAVFRQRFDDQKDADRRERERCLLSNGFRVMTLSD